MKVITSILFITVLFSCNSKVGKKEEKIVKQPLSEYSNLKNDLANKPKIFLKFWSNMKEQDFDTVVKILIKDKILEKENYSTINYLTADDKFRLTPIFENGVLKQIELDGKYLYDLYQEKYNLPKLIEKNINGRKYVVKNLDYEPTMKYRSDNGIVDVPNCFIDNSSYSIGNLPIDDNERKQKVLPTSPIIVKKKNCTIIIEQTFYDLPSPIVTYSLQLNPEMQKYSTEHPLMDLSPLGGIIQKNSKYKIIQKISSSVIKIVYKSNEEYKKENLKIEQSERKLDEENKFEQKQKNIRTKSVKNEI